MEGITAVRYSGKCSIVWNGHRHSSPLNGFGLCIYGIGGHAGRDSLRHILRQEVPHPAGIAALSGFRKLHLAQQGVSCRVVPDIDNLRVIRMSEALTVSAPTNPATNTGNGWNSIGPGMCLSPRVWKPWYEETKRLCPEMWPPQLNGGR